MWRKRWRHSRLCQNMYVWYAISVSMHYINSSLVFMFKTMRRTPSDRVFSIWLNTLIARFMGPTWGPSGADRTQVGPMLSPWTLLYGVALWNVWLYSWSLKSKTVSDICDWDSKQSKLVQPYYSVWHQLSLNYLVQNVTQKVSTAGEGYYYIYYMSVKYTLKVCFWCFFVFMLHTCCYAKVFNPAPDIYIYIYIYQISEYYQKCLITRTCVNMPCPYVFLGTNCYRYFYQHIDACDFDYWFGIWATCAINYSPTLSVKWSGGVKLELLNGNSRVIRDRWHNDIRRCCWWRRG